jgi:hypothetical protein
MNKSKILLLLVELCLVPLSARAQEKPLLGLGIESVVPLAIEHKEGDNEAFFKVTGSLRYQKRQTPNPTGIRLQIDYSNPTDKDITIKYPVDSINILLMDEYRRIIKLPTIRSNMQTQGVQSTQANEGEKVTTPFIPFLIVIHRLK